jgi:hypothetical protein
LFAERAVARELTRLTEAQQADGGWAVDFESASPAAALEWRANRTVNNLRPLDVTGTTTPRPTGLGHSRRRLPRTEHGDGSRSVARLVDE